MKSDEYQARIDKALKKLRRAEAPFAKVYKREYKKIAKLVEALTKKYREDTKRFQDAYIEERNAIDKEFGRRCHCCGGKT